jgi:hypothetical protein
MPETRVEQALFVLGLLAIAALGFLVVHLWRHTHAPAVGPPLSRASPLPTAISEHTTTKRPATTPTTSTPVLSVGHVSLRLTAKSSTWLEVRAGSSSGAVLYVGTLATGSSRAFRERALWVRFGAAGNLIARLDRKIIPLRSGTYDAVFDESGLRKVVG